ncbi:MAG: DUF58 domain-containing protein [Bryobacteraceae bacterium]|nr:DUF58 domain-containing protein [Bryobacteraceae bacterium]
MLWLWRKFRSWVAGGVRQQVTLGGLFYTLAALMVGIAAFASANNLLFLLLSAMLAGLLISNFISRLTLAGLELEFQLPDHISARRKASARIQVRNAKRWTPSFSIHLAGVPGTGIAQPLYFPMIPGRSSAVEAADALFPARGTYRDNTFHFSTRFPFGFTERRVPVQVVQEVLVYPCIDPQPGFEELLTALQGEMESQVRGRGHDFYRIRPYEMFESARHVDWRATAHTGELQVREFAREQDPIIQVYLDLNVPPAATPWFETAVDCCAFLVWRVSHQGARVHFRTQTFDLRLPEDGDVYAILKYLAVVAPLPGRPVAAPHDEPSVQVVFTPQPDKVVEAGWSTSWLLSPDTLHGGGAIAGDPGAGSQAPGTADDSHHGDGKDRRRNARGNDSSRP